MPEGDTLLRTANSLRPALAGRTIVAASSNDRQHDVDSLIGRPVDCVEARGKHLLIHLVDGGAIHSHMGMTGSWHIYEVGQTWQKSERAAALTLQTDLDYVAVCFTPKSLELLSAVGLRRHPWLSRLGPDILDSGWSVDEMISRFRGNNHVPLGVAVLDQRIVCGIGNVYKSELLFLERLNPFGPVSEVSDSALASLLTRGHDLMRRNLGGKPRRTRFGQDGIRKWVYRRQGEACLKCGDAIEMQRQGDLGRSTYFCRTCQLH